ncbi:IS701 family transposase [Tautonia plasticadhaerens]|uniref:Transposase DDE domain protein n=1 Tax=Tautonia plasticadhaerens TaxID=2527974 RepID=A0A518H0N1_9BACT|nr:IS701 family transposase [Tautonia plasticadhaerens]QDV34402.1 Transposase DDE domain protein [Tautonia plasticadhaerens]
MNRTYTPELAPDVLDRLAAYAAGFRDDFNRPRQAAWCGVYLRGLIQDGDRKSAEPMAARVPPPAGLEVSDPDQALQQFLGQSTWDEQAVPKRYWATMAADFADPAGIFAIDDTTFPKQGTRSVGVQRQYCGVLGKKANCQCAVSVHYVSPKGHYPLDMRLYLPESWLGDEPRLDKAGVPEDQRRPLTKGQIALELLDRVRAEGLPGGLVVADSGYGVSGPSRDGLAARGLHYIVGVTDEMVVFTEQPRWVAPAAATGGRPQKRPRLAEGSPRPVSLKELAARTPRRKVTWREGTKGPMWGRFAWLRVWPGQGWATGQCAMAEPIWLLIEEQADGKLKYAFSNLPADTSRLRAVRLWRSRWPVELGYQQMKEELGLDHHEGRSWRGFHHHACLVMLAFGFLTLEQHRTRRGRSRPGKKGEAEVR